MVRVADLIVYGIIGVGTAFSALSVVPDVVLLGLVALAGAPFAFDAAGIRVPPVLAVTVALACVGGVIGLGGGKLAMMIPIAVASWTALRSPSLSLNALVMAGVLGLSVLVQQRHPEGADGGFVYASTMVWAAAALYAAAAGYALRRTNALALQLTAAQNKLATVAAADERRRIAQDVHDLVAHSLAVVLLNITGARRAMSRDQQLADEALARAEAVGRESIEGVRQVVGLLRDADVPSVGGSGPLPYAHDLDALVEGYRRGGLVVELRVDGELDDVDQVAGSVLFRTVREALANVSRHSHGVPAQVEVGIDADAVVVVVRNGLPAGWRHGAAGFGLSGIAERVQALGGEFSAGAVDGRWRLAATIPLGHARRAVRAGAPGLAAEPRHG
ncbi:histidine kinase [Pseudofrankia sp. BMG5.36]|uniref:sensor histidine kinase n=1 Tax=Pseudofrankia sp. BMG5.36 TaxID=1834512 RepID=UPI0008DAE50B|nr:histidine kinase [Pseudofrankia sp. BMG5.36]OHV44809.1 hypothetical protein BCD48_24110 [Pseudofrankia sp. BMG5.36]